MAYRNDTIFGLVKRKDNIASIGNCLRYINNRVEIYISIDGLFKQMAANVGNNFTASLNHGFSKIVWNASGTMGEFAIQIPLFLLRGQTIDFNIDVMDNDDRYKVTQLFPANGSGRSFLGAQLAKLKFVED